MAAALRGLLGVREVVEPELEGGLELLRHALITLAIPPDRQLSIIADARAGG